MNHFYKWGRETSIWDKYLSFSNGLSGKKVDNFHSTNFQKRMIDKNFSLGSFYKEKHIFRMIAIHYQHRNFESLNKNSR
jgi:hypothetical protein